MINDNKIEAAAWAIVIATGTACGIVGGGVGLAVLYVILHAITGVGQ